MEENSGRGKSGNREAVNFIIYCKYGESNLTLTIFQKKRMDCCLDVFGKFGEDRYDKNLLLFICQIMICKMSTWLWQRNRIVGYCEVAE